MKLLISGTRKATHKNDYEKLKAAIEKHYPQVTEILHGGAKGVDTLAELYAIENEIPTTVIRPNYRKHTPKVAPLIRNTELVKKADAVLCYFIDSKTGGTAHTATTAKSAKLPVVEILETNALELF